MSKREVEQTLRLGKQKAAKHGRLEAEKVLPYNDVWDGVFYRLKKVRVVFTTNTVIRVYTVYAFYIV